MAKAVGLKKNAISENFRSRIGQALMISETWGLMEGGAKENSVFSFERSGEWTKGKKKKFAREIKKLTIYNLQNSIPVHKYLKRKSY